MTAIAPRATRLLRASDLHAFREAAVALACDGPPLAARDRILVVPTHAAAVQLTRAIQRRRGSSQALVLPVFATPDELVWRFGERLPLAGAPLTAVEREAIMGAAARAAADAGCPPPFRLRPPLVAEMLRFYDTLRGNRRDIPTFERLALGRLEPGAEIDRGARRLVVQTHFLAAAFREFERRCAEHGVDRHLLRERVIAEPGARPFRHVVVAVGDRAFDPYGLDDATWDLLARVPGLQGLDVLVTDVTLAGAMHERIHAVLPGIEEVRVDDFASSPVLSAPGDGRLAWVARDREEEVAAFARRAKLAVRRGETTPDRVALVVQAPLPYVYLAREVCRAAGIPLRLFEDLPLAGEPFAAALDVLFTAVTSGFVREASIALLRSPHFRFEPPPGGVDTTIAAGMDPALRPGEIAALDRALAESRYEGGADALEALVSAWRGATPGGRQPLRAGEVLLAVVRELTPLRAEAPVAAHLERVLEFLARHAREPQPDDPLCERQLRARGAVVAALVALRDGWRRFDAAPVSFDQTAALVRRRIEAATFAPEPEGHGVAVIDAESARFGDFDLVQLAGLVDGEWPEPARRDIFYPSEVLRELGWPAASGRHDAARARFLELLRLPSQRAVLSIFSLEGDVLVSPSSLLDEVPAAGLEVVEEPEPPTLVFEREALALDPPDLSALSPEARAWAEHRMAARQREPRPPGMTSPHTAAAWSVSALERYQDCPFRFFAADVLRLEDPVESSTGLTPRERGRFLHDVLHRFYQAWTDRGRGAITPANYHEARALFAEVAAPLLELLGPVDAALERARLFGTAVSVGAVDVVLGMEASRSGQVIDRWLELRLEGELTLSPGQRVPLNGVADRIDLLEGRRLRVVDYKTGAAPDPGRALQAGVYALCASERLERRDGRPWQVEEASYVSLAGRRPVVSVVAPADSAARRRNGAESREAPLDEVRRRLLDVLEGIGRGVFVPRPYDVAICRTCAYSSVCRKDYADGD